MTATRALLFDPECALSRRVRDTVTRREPEGRIDGVAHRGAEAVRRRTAGRPCLPLGETWMPSRAWRR